jgi:hypothetical protein
MLDEVREHLREMLEIGAIRESSSPYSSNLVLQRSINLWNVEHAFVRPKGRRLNS